MAWTERYVDPAAGGGGTGTSTGDPFTWAEMITDSATASGTRYWVKGGAYSASVAQTFGGGGTAAAPNMMAGYLSSGSPGTLMTLRDDCTAADLSVTNWPVMTYSSSGKLTLGSYALLHGVKIVAALNGASLSMGTQSQLIHCVVENTHVSGSSVVAVETGTTYSSLLDCDFKTASSHTNHKAVDADRGFVSFCRFISISGKAIQTGLFCEVERCAFVDCYRCVATNGNVARITGCSMRNFTQNCIHHGSGLVVLANNVAYSTATGSRWYNATAVKPMRQIHNAVSATNADSNEGDYPVIGEVSLSGDPFTSSTDLTLDTSGIADCEDAGHGVNIDIGAAQTTPSGGGGGLLTHPGMSGGMRG